jgi:hypothetical protein
VLVGRFGRLGAFEQVVASVTGVLDQDGHFFARAVVYLILAPADVPLLNVQHGALDVQGVHLCGGAAALLHAHVELDGIGHDEFGAGRRERNDRFAHVLAIRHDRDRSTLQRQPTLVLQP